MATYISVPVTKEEKVKLSEEAKGKNLSLAELVKRKMMTPAAEEGMSLSDMMTIKQVAEYLIVSQSKARSLCASGELKSIKLGKSTRVLKSSIQEYVEREIKRQEAPDEVLRPEEAASLLKVSRSTMHRMIASGEINAFAVSKSYRIRKEDVLQMMGA